MRYRRTPDGPEEIRYLSFIYAPLYNEDFISGIFCEGFDVTDAYRATRRMAALARLGDRIREIEDPDELAFAAAEILGRELGVSRACHNQAHQSFQIWILQTINSTTNEGARLENNTRLDR